MKDFKQNNRFGGGRSSGGFPPRGGRPSFGGKPSFGRGGDSQMFSAICATCGKPCEVPFRPNGKKPVYCSNCFAQNEGGGGDRFPRKEYTPSATYNLRPVPVPVPAPASNNPEMQRVLVDISVKLDKLIAILSMPKKPAVKAKKAL